MKKLVIILTGLSLLLLTPVAIAKEKNSEETKIISVPAGKVINKDYFAAGDIVEISGTVNGDVYAFGGQVLVDGTVNGDLIAAGGLVNVSGDVSQDARVGGGQVTISGKIGRNLTVGGGNVELTNSAIITGGVVAGGGNISLAAPVGKDVKIGAGNLTVSNKINGSIEAGVGVMRLTSKAEISGDLTYWSDQKASIDKNAIISGKITKKAPPQAAKPKAEAVVGAFAGFNLFLKIVSFISTLVIGLLLIKLFPLYNKETAATLKKRPWVSLGAGAATLILTPIIMVLLFITIVGIPLGLILGALYLVSLYLSRVFVIFWAGSWVLEKTRGKVHEAWAFIVGLVVYLIITSVPIVGGFVVFFVILFGLGAAILTKKEIYSAARKKELI